MDKMRVEMFVSISFHCKKLLSWVCNSACLIVASAKGGASLYPEGKVSYPNWSKPLRSFKSPMWVSALHQNTGSATQERASAYEGHIPLSLSNNHIYCPVEARKYATDRYPFCLRYMHTLYADWPLVLQSTSVSYLFAESFITCSAWFYIITESSFKSSFGNAISLITATVSHLNPEPINNP